MTRQEPVAPTPVAAFFDVDNTIIRGASAFHIARGLKQRGYFRNRELIRFGWEQLKYLVFGESQQQISTVRNEALSIIKGWSVAEMAAIGEEVYDEILAMRIFPGTKALIDEHCAQGHEVWLVTASPLEIGRLIARRLKATGALGTIAEHKGGFYTGNLVGDLMHGEAKAVAVRELAARRDLDLSRCFAYGDSMNDAPMLGAVGHGCAINPDSRLRRHAKRHGWPVQDFRGRNPQGRRS
ncbi:MAG: HAD-IB family hydrolase, partial [Demequina sp.]|nr:HAD-IB family hydrolase [Demequina sp.]